MAVLALALVVLSTVASLCYKLAGTFSLSPTRPRAILIAHAFFIEAIQIALLVTCILITAFIAGTSQPFRLVTKFRTIPPWLAALSTLTTYALAIMATDIMDNLIQLHTLQHPIQSQTFILTRSILLPQTVLRKARRPLPTVIQRRQRTMSEPATPTVAQQFPWDLPRRTSTPVPGSVAKLVSTFEGCTVALSHLEQQTPSTVYELEGSSVGRSTEEQALRPEYSIGVASTLHTGAPVSARVLQDSPSMKQKIEPAQHKKAARHTQARVEARRRQRAKWLL